MLGLHALKVGLASEARSMGTDEEESGQRVGRRSVTGQFWELGTRWPIEHEDEHEHEDDWGGAPGLTDDSRRR